jgi:hypothetical protein
MKPSARNAGMQSIVLPDGKKMTKKKKILLTALGTLVQGHILEMKV